MRSFKIRAYPPQTPARAETRLRPAHAARRIGFIAEGGKRSRAETAPWREFPTYNNPAVRFTIPSGPGKMYPVDRNDRRVDPGTRDLRTRTGLYGISTIAREEE